MNDSYLVLENFPFTFPSLNIIRHKKKKKSVRRYYILKLSYVNRNQTKAFDVIFLNNVTYMTIFCSS